MDAIEKALNQYFATSLVLVAHMHEDGSWCGVLICEHPASNSKRAYKGWRHLDSLSVLQGEADKAAEEIAAKTRKFIMNMFGLEVAIVGDINLEIDKEVHKNE